jgi:hypothetical protein
MKIPVLVILSFVCIHQAGAAWNLTDGNSLIEGIKTLRRAEAHENLTDHEIIVASVTAGYLRGFLDSSIRWSEVDQDSLFKLPEHGIPLPQFVQVIEKFLTEITDKPQLLHLPADGLILEVLVKDFPNPALKKKD